MKYSLVWCLLCVLLLTACSPENTNVDSSAGEAVSLVIVKTVTTTTSHAYKTIAGTDPTTKERRESKTGTNTSVSRTTSATIRTHISSMTSAATVTSTTTITTSLPVPQTTTPVATAQDAERIADVIIEHINRYRVQEGATATEKLPGLTAYAQLRSQQLCTNYAHDTHDTRAAATALQYGEYIDPSLYGMTGEPYYTANAQEAIARIGYNAAADTIAADFAGLVHRSAAHWRYVGGQENRYIAVGLTSNAGVWYCCITVTDVNTG